MSLWVHILVGVCNWGEVLHNTDAYARKEVPQNSMSNRDS